MNFKPFEVEIYRGSKVESRQTVHAALYSFKKNKIEVYGDSQLSVFPRSSLKPIQALPLLVSGASHFFNLTDEELTLACASHRGQLIHTEPIKKWLLKIGFKETDLECGTHAPMDQESLFSLLKSNGGPSPIHNNCSGKHTGMLTLASFLKITTKNYVSFSHPVQQKINEAIAKLCHIKLSDISFGIDGCSIPAPCLPLIKLAEGFAEFSTPTRLNELESNACKQLYAACVAHPLLLAGSGHYNTEMMIETKGRVLLKGGAEGVMTMAIPDLEMGIALKAIDGNSRATEFCSSILLQKLGLIDNSSLFLEPKIKNWNNIETSSIRLKV